MDILSKCAKLGISPDEYYFLYCKVHTINTDKYILRLELTSLEEKGLIKITSEGVHLRQKGIDIFIDKEDRFATFWSIYPIKVPNSRGPGYRVLKTKSTESKDYATCKAKFNKLPHDKDLVIKCLMKELEERRLGGNLPFMQEAETWLNGRTYEKYIDLLEEQEEIQKSEKEDRL